jgi:TolB-like protein/Tfp pilus assembly protein PilF
MPPQSRNEDPLATHTVNKPTPLDRMHSREAITSLAVLPFVNAIADPGTEYLSDGISENIIYSLSQLPNLRVMARSTMFRYKGKDVDPQTVGRDLGVQAVLSGRVLQSGDRFLVAAELVDVADGSLIWGGQYRRRSGDIFDVQEEITREIVEGLRLKLTGEDQKRLTKRSSINPEANQAYLRGRYHLNKYTNEEIKKAIRYFNQAIEMDPDFALAYAGLADSYYRLSNVYLLPSEAMAKARRSAMKALEIDDAIAEAHASLASIGAYYDWDWALAEQEFKRAIELAASFATAHQRYAMFLAAMGRLDEALEHMDTAQGLDPLLPLINTGIGWIHLMARRYEQAIEECQKAFELAPQLVPAHNLFGIIYEQKGMFEEAIAEFQKAQLLDDAPMILALLGRAFASAGKKDEARQVLEELKLKSGQRYVSPYLLALIYTALGERDEAFAWLQKTYDDRNEMLVWLKVDIRLDALRLDPRFTALLQRAGFIS